MFATTGLTKEIPGTPPQVVPVHMREKQIFSSNPNSRWTPDGVANSMLRRMLEMENAVYKKAAEDIMAETPGGKEPQTEQIKNILSEAKEGGKGSEKGLTSFEEVKEAARKAQKQKQQPEEEKKAAKK